MLELLQEIGAFVDRMGVHSRTSHVEHELHEIIVSFLAESLKAIVSLSSLMESKTTGAPISARSISPLLNHR